jgi:hypothetical protein
MSLPARINKAASCVYHETQAGEATAAGEFPSKAIRNLKLLHGAPKQEGIGTQQDGFAVAKNSLAVIPAGFELQKLRPP